MKKKKPDNVVYYRQSGYNPSYPEVIEIYNPGTDKKVPEWLSDRARVVNIDSETGNPILFSRPTNTGGIEIYNSDMTLGVLVMTRNPSDLICFGDNRVFCLRKRQLELLYSKVE